MNFEEAYEKFLNGTANAEEVQFVADEIRKAKEIDRILNLPVDQPIFASASEETISKARKSFNSKHLVRTILILLCSLGLIAAIVCGIIFIPSTISAKQSRKYTRDECTQLAIERAIDYFDDSSDTEFVVHDVDRHLSLRNGLTKAVYMYEVELRNGEHRIELYVNASSGYTEVTDISRNR